MYQPDISLFSFVPFHYARFRVRSRFCLCKVRFKLDDGMELDVHLMNNGCVMDVSDNIIGRCNDSSGAYVAAYGGRNSSRGISYDDDVDDVDIVQIADMDANRGGSAPNDDTSYDPSDYTVMRSGVLNANVAAHNIGQDHWYNLKFSELMMFINKEGRYECPRTFCDKSYKDASSLQRHIRCVAIYHAAIVFFKSFVC